MGRVELECDDGISIEMSIPDRVGYDEFVSHVERLENLIRRHEAPVAEAKELEQRLTALEEHAQRVIEVLDQMTRQS